MNNRRLKRIGNLFEICMRRYYSTFSVLYQQASSCCRRLLIYISNICFHFRVLSIKFGLDLHFHFRHLGFYVRLDLRFHAGHIFVQRTEHLKYLIVANFNPSNLVVLLNGDEKKFISAKCDIRIPPEAKILQYPLFVGLTPTSNRTIVNRPLELPKLLQ